MARCRRLLAAAVATVGIFPSVAGAAPRTVHSRPALTVRLSTNQITAGQSVQISYDATAVPRADVVVIQRPVGTGGRYQTMRQLGHNKSRVRGSVLVTPPGQGKWTYRLAIGDHHGRLVAAKYLVIYAYGTIPLSSMLDFPENDVVQIPGGLFHYTFAGRPAINDADPTVIFTNQASTCRSVTVNGVFDPSLAPFGFDTVGTMTVVQENADPSSVSVPIGTVGTLTVSLAPGAWALDASETSTGVFGNGWLYANGTAQCWTRDGRTY